MVKEADVIGVSDHLASELPSLRFVDLDAAQINSALDALERSTDHVRTVIVPRD